jgi:VanZ family protein
VRHARTVLAVAAVALQMVVLYAPSGPDMGDVGLPVDKVVHVAVFALATWALAAAGMSPGWSVALMAAHAPISELVQHLVLPDRSGDPADVVADLLGVALGAVLAGRTVRRVPARPR